MSSTASAPALSARGLVVSGMDARGIKETEIMEGARRSTMDELAAATIAADKVLVF